MKRLAIIAVLAAVVVAASTAAWIWVTRVHVVEGDAIQIGFRVYSVVGYQTPQGGEAAQCDSERMLATRARTRLTELVEEGAQMTHIICACEPGWDNLMQCNNGRLCARLESRGRDVADILIGEGLARPYVCARWSCPKRGSWC